MAHYQVEWGDGEWSEKSFAVTEKEFLNDPDPAGFPWSSPEFSVLSDASVADPLTDPTFHHKFDRRRKIARNQGPCGNRTEVEFQICYHGCCYGCCCCCCCWDSRWPLWWCCYCCNGLSAWWHCLSRWLAGCGGQLSHCCTRFRNSGSLLMMMMLLLSRWLWLMSPFCLSFSLNSSWLQAKQKSYLVAWVVVTAAAGVVVVVAAQVDIEVLDCRFFFVSFCVQVAA